jgi:hypothetical protein
VYSEYIFMDSQEVFFAHFYSSPYRKRVPMHTHEYSYQVRSTSTSTGTSYDTMCTVLEYVEVQVRTSRALLYKLYS